MSSRLSRVVTILCVVVFTCIVVGTIAKVCGKSAEQIEQEKEILDRLRRRLYLLNPEYAKVPLKVDTSSYTEDKSMIGLCVRDPMTGQYFNDNVLMYVVLHELAHFLSKSYGHNNEFRNTFQSLLEDAREKCLYDPTQKFPEVYCGVT